MGGGEAASPACMEEACLHAHVHDRTYALRESQGLELYNLLQASCIVGGVRLSAFMGIPEHIRAIGQCSVWGAGRPGPAYVAGTEGMGRS